MSSVAIRYQAIDSAGRLLATACTAGFTLACLCFPGANILVALSCVLPVAGISAGMSRFVHGCQLWTHPPKGKMNERRQSIVNPTPRCKELQNPAISQNKYIATEEILCGLTLTSLSGYFGYILHESTVFLPGMSGQEALSFFAKLPALHWIVWGFAINAVTEFCSEWYAYRQFCKVNSVDFGFEATAGEESVKMKIELYQKGIKAALWLTVAFGVTFAPIGVPLIAGTLLAIQIDWNAASRIRYGFFPTTREKEEIAKPITYHQVARPLGA